MDALVRILTNITRLDKPAINKQEVVEMLEGVNCSQLIFKDGDRVYQISFQKSVERIISDEPKDVEFINKTKELNDFLESRNLGQCLDDGTLVFKDT